MHLRLCKLLYATETGTARLMFRCDYSSDSSLDQLKSTDRLLQYRPELVDCLATELTAESIEGLQERNPASALL